jgi:hypothetical protein
VMVVDIVYLRAPPVTIPSLSSSSLLLLSSCDYIGGSADLDSHTGTF